MHRQLIWANRIAGASSFGASRLLYHLGGVESWFNPTWNDETVVDVEAGYAFQTIATNMRGHSQNIRNGNSYAVFNSELRVPIFTYLINKPIRSELVPRKSAGRFFVSETTNKVAKGLISPMVALNSTPICRFLTTR